MFSSDFGSIAVAFMTSKCTASAVSRRAGNMSNHEIFGFSRATKTMLCVSIISIGMMSGMENFVFLRHLALRFRKV